MELVRSVSSDDALLAAAWLHDTVEDTDSTLGDIESHFGPRVAELVEMLTDSAQPQAKNRVARKIAYFRHTATALPEAKTIKLADIIDNTRAIVRFDPYFARVYLVEKRIQIDFFNRAMPNCGDRPAPLSSKASPSWAPYPTTCRTAGSPGRRPSTAACNKKHTGGRFSFFLLFSPVAAVRDRDWHYALSVRFSC
ncbi:GTP pyrophosphokinase rsh|nr:GTP pyrophosphokinase rsh [Candidatus Pantoea persica]